MRVVSLHTGLHVDGDAEGCQQLLDPPQLLAQLWRGFRAVRLIVGIELFAKCLLAGVHRYCQECRGALLDEPLQHVDRAVNRMRGFTARTSQRRDGVVGAENVPADIHDVEDITSARLK